MDMDGGKYSHWVDALNLYRNSSDKLGNTLIFFLAKSYVRRSTPLSYQSIKYEATATHLVGLGLA